MRLGLISFIVLLSSFAHAAILVPDENIDTANSTTIKQTPTPKKTSEFNLGLNLENYSYFEPGPNIKISGFLPGIVGEYRQHLGQGEGFFAFGGGYSAGSLTYDGTLINGDETIPLTSPTKDYIANVQGLMGSKIEFDDIEFEYSGGIAYRYLTDQGENEGAYLREQTYIYLPLSFAIKTYLQDNFALKLGLETDIFMSGTNVSHLDEVNPIYPTFTFHQSTGSGSRIYARLSRPLPSMNNNLIYGELAYRTWAIEGSSTQAYYNPNLQKTLYYHEPENKTESYGLAIGVIF